MDNRAIFAVCKFCLLLVASVGAMKANAQTVEYIHTDALGTPIAVTDSAGTIVERSEYEPFGQLVNRPLTDGPGFAGHVQDVITGLTYMQQRYYDPSLGRFLSVDPVTAYSRPVANFNRYWYATGNPFKFSDPDGRQSVIRQLQRVLGGPVRTGGMKNESEEEAPPDGSDNSARRPPENGRPGRDWTRRDRDGEPLYGGQDGPRDEEEAGNRIKDLVGENPTSDVLAQKPPGNGWTWRGKPGEQPGSSKGAWVRDTGEQIHNDLDTHAPGSARGPHVTYTDKNGKRWDYFPESGSTVEQK
jgi:RHS repeat-associated protein